MIAAKSAIEDNQFVGCAEFNEMCDVVAFPATWADILKTIKFSQVQKLFEPTETITITWVQLSLD